MSDEQEVPERIWIDWNEREFHLKPLKDHVEYVRSDLAPVAELRSNPRVNLLLVALRKVRDNVPTLEAAKAVATIAIEEYVESGKETEQRL